MTSHRWRLALIGTALLLLAVAATGAVAGGSRDAASNPETADQVVLAAPAGDPVTGSEPAAEKERPARERKRGDRAHPFRGLQHRLRQVIHAEVTLDLPDKGPTTFTLDHGTITALDAASLSLRAKDGRTHTLALTGETRVRKEGKRGALADLKVGDEVLVFSRLDAAGEGLTARRIVVPREKPAGEGGG